MRVIAGEARGVPLMAPPGRATRPTSDRTKEAMFAVLGDLGCEGTVLDLFAGSGALGIEALSRGATFCDFVESAAPACRAIKANLQKTRLPEQGAIHQLPVARYLAGAHRGGPEGPGGPGGPNAPYDLILLDPPYGFAGLEDLLRALGASPLVGPRTALMVEHERGRALPPRLGGLALDRSRVHGDSAFTLYLPERETVPAGARDGAGGSGGGTPGA
ncbi:MAG TPA: 16S rRNA (guanine(966)-N(2))-methyltransferase RsmD [Chloroflexota bacterium]|nr:16S rRNA (guanine(966)-N(2))-methyltransferase RsmD [Chloroflexota bacterium]